MLRVLEGTGLVDALVVCVRWFGGTKLGTGGLVRAYTEGVQGVVAEALAQGLLEEVRLWSLGTLRVPDGLAHLPYATLGGYPGAEILGQTFAAGEASITFRVPQGQEAGLETLWQEKSRGGTVRWGAFADPSPPFADRS
jgi:putative IMPACT (imprinted ancient) family translation regulator